MFESAQMMQEIGDHIDNAAELNALLKTALAELEDKARNKYKKAIKPNSKSAITPKVSSRRKSNTRSTGNLNSGLTTISTSRTIPRRKKSRSKSKTKCHSRSYHSNRSITKA